MAKNGTKHRKASRAMQLWKKLGPQHHGGWLARFARGILTVLDRRGMSVLEASQYMGIDDSTLYRVVGANCPQATARNADMIAAKLGLDICEVIKLGTTSCTR